MKEQINKRLTKTHNKGSAQNLNVTCSKEQLQQKLTPVANLTPMRFPLNSCPLSSHLASSASWGSQNSCSMIQQTKNTGAVLNVKNFMKYQLLTRNHNEKFYLQQNHSSP
jgi:hypothetical protein